MKKSTFLDLVCRHLAECSLPDAEILRQRTNIDAYLSSLGIGEESNELDAEDANEFAEEILEVFRAHTAPSGSPEARTDFSSDVFAQEDITLVNQPLAPEEIIDEPPYEEYTATQETDESETDIETADNIYIPQENEDGYEKYSAENTPEIPVFDVDEVKNEDFYEENGDYDDSYGAGEDVFDSDDEEEGVTREFDRSELSAEEPTEEDYGDYLPAEEEYNDSDYESDEEEQAYPKGNPVMFWILAVALSPFWGALLILALALVGLSYAFLFAMMTLYMPIIIAVIFLGSVTGIAELIYGISKLIGKSAEIGLFELGICCAVVALTIVLSIIIYWFGSRIAPMAIKRFGIFLKKAKKKVKKTVRKIKGVCSI